MAELAALFGSGVFFGAALYISAVQHPALLEAGAPFALRFFGPMYRRASVLQAAMALLGATSGAWSWWHGAGLAWLAASLLLVAVIPFTLLRVAPVNEQLMAPGRSVEAPDNEALLRRWGALHSVRTVLSGLAFSLMLVAGQLG